MEPAQKVMFRAFISQIGGIAAMIVVQADMTHNRTRIDGS
jgi:hypothetical protein